MDLHLLFDLSSSPPSSLSPEGPFLVTDWRPEKPTKHPTTRPRRRRCFNGTTQCQAAGVKRNEGGKHSHTFTLRTGWQEPSRKIYRVCIDVGLLLQVPGGWNVKQVQFEGFWTRLFILRRQDFTTSPWMRSCMLMLARWTLDSSICPSPFIKSNYFFWLVSTSLLHLLSLLQYYCLVQYGTFPSE